MYIQELLASAASATTSLIRKSQIKRWLKVQEAEILTVPAADLDLYLDALAQVCDVDLRAPGAADDLAAAAAFLGEVTATVPLAHCNGPTKIIFRSKIRRLAPGVSAVSAPPARRFDWSGAKTFALYKIAQILCATYTDDAGRTATIAERFIVDADLKSAMARKIGAGVDLVAAAITKRLEAGGRPAGVDRFDKQVFLPAGDGKYLLVSPQASQLQDELARRLRSREDRGLPAFRTVTQQFGDGRALRHGITTCNAGGARVKLVCELPRNAHDAALSMPAAATAGRYLVVGAENILAANFTGADITAGLSTLNTAAIGAAEAWRREVPALGGIEGVAVGVSAAEMHVLDMLTMIPVSRKGIQVEKGQPGPISEITGELRGAYLIVKLAAPVAAGVAAELAPALHRGRLAGGAMWGAKAALTDDAGLGVWLQKTSAQFLVDKTADHLSAHGDRLDLLLDALAANPQLCPICIGHQLVEPPRPRGGTRDAETRHAYSIAITGVGQWIQGNDFTEKPVYWRYRWDREALAVIAEAAAD